MKHLNHYVIIFTSYFFPFYYAQTSLCSVCSNRETSHKDVLRNFSEQGDLFQCFSRIFTDGIIGIITDLP